MADKPGPLATFLRTVPLFQGLSDADAARIARKVGPPKTIKPNLRDPEAAAIYLAGAPSTALYIVLDEPRSGRDAPPDPSTRPVVQVSVEDDKLTTRVRLWRVYPRQYFGELEYLAGSEAGRFPIRLTRAVALNACRVLELPFKLLNEIVDDHPIVFRRLSREVIARFQETLEDTLASKVSDPDVALACWMVERARDFGIRQGSQVRFRTTISQEDIGRDLGVTRETISLRLNEWRRRGLIASTRGTHFVIGDIERVDRIASLAIERSREEHSSAVASVDQALARGDNFRARNFALDLLGYFPGSAELKHRAVLAVARCGATRAALGLIEHFGFGPDMAPDTVDRMVRIGVADPLQAPKAHYDSFDLEDIDERLTELGEKPKVAELAEDILALAPRLWKDIAFAGKELDRDAAERAYAGYCKAFAASARPYTGVNAASLAFLLGRPQEGLAHAKQVLHRLRNPHSYWDYATKGEAQLLCGDAGAVKSFQMATQCPDAWEGSIAATRLQLARLAEAGISGGSDVLGILHAPAVAIVAGPALREPGALTATDGEALADAVRQIIRERRIGHVYSALASGPDIVIAETAQAEGANVHVVLPLGIEDHVATALTPMDTQGATQGWKDRFDRCLERAASLTVHATRSIPARDTDSAYYHNHRYAAGHALLKAEALTSHCLLIGGGAEAASGRYARLVRDWKASGRDAVTLPSGSTHTARTEPDDTGWRPVILVWLFTPNGKQGHMSARALSDESIAAAEAIIRSNVDSGMSVMRRALRGNRPQVALVAIPNDMQTAVEVAGRLLRAPWPKDLVAQVTLDFGPVLGHDGKPHEDRLRELDIGAGPLEVPDGTLVASAAFAMEARLGLNVAGSIVALGRVARLASSGGPMLLPSTEIYALRVPTPATPTKSSAGRRRLRA